MELIKEPIYTLVLNKEDIKNLWDLLTLASDSGDKRANEFLGILENYAGKQY